MKLFGRPRRRCSIMTTARWEAPYIAEWLAYHQALGFDHVYLYANDDDPAELYTAAAAWIEGPKPFVTFIHCPHQGQQWWMFLHFLQTHKDETDWVLFLDVDEFLSLRRDRTIGELLERRPRDLDCVYFHWTMFGHAGFRERPPGSVLRQYTRRAAGLNPYTKTLTRTARIAPELLRPELRGAVTHPHHGWERRFSPPGLRVCDVTGADMGDYWPDCAAGFARLRSDPAWEARVWSEAVIHHYAFRSEADFQRRAARGLGGDFAGQATWVEREAQGGAAAFLAELDAVEDRTLAELWAGILADRTAMRGMYPARPGPPVSHGRPCLQSSVWSPDGTPIDPAVQAGGAVDGRPLTGRPAFHTEAEAHPWWWVDLGAPHHLDEVRLYNRMDGSEMPERADRIAIAVSDDGRVWREVHRRTAAGSFGGVDGRPLRWLPTAPLTARFIRLELQGSVLHLEQVEVFGRPVRPSPAEPK